MHKLCSDIAHNYMKFHSKLDWDYFIESQAIYLTETYHIHKIKLLEPFPVHLQVRKFPIRCEQQFLCNKPFMDNLMGVVIQTTNIFEIIAGHYSIPTSISVLN